MNYRNLSSFFVLAVVLLACRVYAQTFEQYAETAGLTGSETSIKAPHKLISSLDGLANNYSSLQQLELNRNQLRTINAGDFLGLTNLDSLHLGANEISDLEDGAFQGLTKLRSLTLSTNQMSSLRSGQFSGLNSLQTLKLTENQISSIGTRNFQPLTNLRTLSLGNNNISSIAADAFAGPSHLITLYLGFNDLTSIKADYLRGLSSLQLLDFRSNRISSIEAGAFNGQKILARLYLCNNNIRSIEGTGFQNLDRLHTLDLSNNQLANIGSTTFAAPRSLQTLNLAGNEISQIADDAFSKLRYLKELNLDRNKIERLNLQKADLSSLERFSIDLNPVDTVILSEIIVGQNGFDALMFGSKTEPWYSGLVFANGVGFVDFSKTDFSAVHNLSAMYGMDSLETLSFAGSSNLGGEEVADLTANLDSLSWLDVTGPWETWSGNVQAELLAWDAVEGHTLVVPEPVSLVLVGLGAVGLIRRRRVG